MRFDGQGPFELYLPHAVVSAITAGFAGEIAAVETLMDLGCEEDLQNRVDFARPVVAWMSEWTSHIFAGRY